MIEIILQTFLDGLETWVQVLLRQGMAKEAVQRLVIQKLESIGLISKIDPGEVMKIVLKVADQLHLAILSLGGGVL